MRYTYPHYASKHECIVPDMCGWQQLREGMTFDEVTSLVGPPITDSQSCSDPDRLENGYLCYGWIDLPGVPHPRTYSFVVGFDEDRRLWLKQSPFGNDSSEEGLPTSPRIIIPADEPEYDHYPRIIDVRWRPPAGHYPMRFELQLGHGDLEGKEFYDQTVDEELTGLHYCTEFPGGQPGRVRVRASNSKGTGLWSEYRYFEFLQ